MTLRVAAHGFGPIRSASIAVSPLTIFLGPNNTGKSYLAMLAYALTRTNTALAMIESAPLGGPLLPSLYRRYRVEMPANVEKAIRDAQKKGGYRRGSLPASTLDGIQKLLVQTLTEYAEWWKTEIERCFGQKLPDLVQPHTRGNSITVTHSDPAWEVKVGLRSGSVEVTHAPDAEAVLAYAMTDANLGTRLPGIPSNLSLDISMLPTSVLWDLILQSCLRSCLREFPPAAYYLPAARSGILQSHRTLTSLLWRRASMIGVEDLRLPTMTGVLTDFITLLLNLAGKRPGELNETASFIEDRALRGSIRIKSSGDYPEITYENQHGRYQLHTTSSMVSEMAPVVLLLRHYVQRGDVLIIEEPESHLHPSVQREAARVISRLVNAGVVTVVTTHSDYFMTQLNNLVTGSELSDRERHEAGLESDDCLSASLVSAYLFDPTSQDSTRVRPLPVDRVHGIPLQEFTAVAEGLYNQTLSLESSALDAR